MDYLSYMIVHQEMERRRREFLLPLGAESPALMMDEMQHDAKDGKVPETAPINRMAAWFRNRKSRIAKPTQD